MATIQLVGFVFINEHITVLGAINFEQRVNRWYMSREKYQSLEISFDEEVGSPRVITD